MIIIVVAVVVVTGGHWLFREESKELFIHPLLLAYFNTVLRSYL